GRDRDDGHAHIERSRLLLELGKRVNGDPVNFHSKFLWIVVKKRDDLDVETVVLPDAVAVVAGQRLPQAADPYERHPDLPVEVEDPAQFILQIRHLVADALFAEFAEPRQIFANQRWTDTRPFAKFLGGHELAPFVPAHFLQDP